MRWFEGRPSVPILFTVLLQVLALVPLPGPHTQSGSIGGLTGVAVRAGQAVGLQPGAALWNSMHPPSYALLAWLWCAALFPRAWRRGAVWTAAFCLAVAAGSWIEFSQVLASSRNPSLSDGLLNVLGAAIGVGLHWLGRKLWPLSST